MIAVTWQTIDGEFTKHSLSAHDTIEEATATAALLNSRLGPGANYRWHAAELKEVF